MRTLISHYSNPPFLFKFTSSFPQINLIPTFYLHQKCLLKPHNILVFPPAFIVFAIGFSFGFVKYGPNNKGFSSNGVNRREKGESLGFYVDKLKALEQLFDGVDVQVSDLKSVVKKAIDDERVDLSELESYVNVLESIGVLVLDASAFLKQAKECLKGRNDEMFAEEMLHESAKLLSQAITMKPMSLLAIGQLGNTYLLHGELKLRVSRELRNHLSRNENFGRESQGDFLSSVNEALLNKERIATSLGKTCEDCEALLVQAGRKYRTALTIDGNDLRALYNWGLALFFRAQLIADIGPEAALDADKLFLAAIDKFDAMMSRSNVYAPEALFRWGMALQQRSRLRPSSSRDKVKLLQQATRLYKDALNMGSDNIQVRKALASCISELNLSDK